MILHRILTAVLTASITLLAAWTVSAEDTPPPNVLFIASDDLRPELGCYGTRAVTPNIDRLAATGLQFDRAYCNQAVCGASRISLMTGLYPEFTGERSYHVTDWRKRWATTITLNQHFKSNGYTTVGLGKIYHGSAGAGVDPENWTEWIRVKGAEYSDPASFEAQTNNPRNTSNKRRGPSTEGADVPDDVHVDGQRAKVGAERIHQLAKAGKPFFLAVGFTKPHLPFVAPKKYWDLYRRDQFNLPPNLGKPPGYPDFASNIGAGELRAYSDIPRKGTPSIFPDELNRRLIHGYHAAVSYTDRNVGVLLQALETSGAASNTIVVFWADHGWKLGDHSSWCKHTNFECDARVPLIIRHPGMPAAKGNTKALVELIDLYPTLADLCGLETPDHVQGNSLSPILDNPQASIRRSAYSSYSHGRGKGLTSVVGHSIRTSRHRYTEWWEKETDTRVAAVLTDIDSDPGETTAVRNNPLLKSKLSKLLEKRVKAARKISEKK